MKFDIIGKNIVVTDGLRSAVEDKIGKLEKYFTPDTEVHVTLSVEKERQKIEVTIPVKGNIIRSEVTGPALVYDIFFVIYNLKIRGCEIEHSLFAAAFQIPYLINIYCFHIITLRNTFLLQYIFSGFLSQ